MLSDPGCASVPVPVFFSCLCILMYISNSLCIYIDHYFTLILVRSYIISLVLTCVIPSHAEHLRTLLGLDSLTGLSVAITI